MVRRLFYYTVAVVALVGCHLTLWYVPEGVCQEIGDADIAAQIHAYKAQLDADSTQIETRLQLAKAYLRIAAYTESVETYQQLIAAVEAAPHSEILAEAYYGLGLAYVGLEKFEEAIAAYQQAITYRPDWAYSHAALASAYANMHRYTEALDVYKVAVKLDPTDEMIHHQLGNVYSKRGKNAAAIRHQRQAIAIAPAFAAAHYQLGLLYAQEKQWSQAITSYRIAYEYDATLVEALYNLAQAHLRTGDTTAAREQMALFEKQKAALTPLSQLRGALQRTQETKDRAQILANIGRLYLKNGLYEKAVWEYQKALGMDVTLVPAYNGIGIAYTMLERYPEAVAAQQKALALQPDFAQAYAGLGLVYFRQNKLEPALEHYRHAVVLEPDFLDAHLKIGAILRKQRRYAAALDTYRTVLRLKPDDPEIHHNLGICYARQAKSDLAAARRYAEAAIRLNPKVASYYNTLALIDFRRGDYLQAEKAIRKALQLDSENPNYQQGLKQISGKLAAE